MVDAQMEKFMSDLLYMFDETFTNVVGIYLNRGTSLFETLATISAEEASRPVSATCASIAAQTDHIRFYLDVLEKRMRGEETGKIDWGDIWARVQAVTEDEWILIQTRLSESHQRVRAFIASPEVREKENGIDSAMAIIVHTAYHLGEIRQALCTLR